MNSPDPVSSDAFEAFEAELQAAEVEPEQFNLQLMWVALEALLAERPAAEHLAIAGIAIEHFARILLQRAEQMLSEWEQAPLQELPIFPNDLLLGLMRQSTTYNIDDLFDSPPPHKPRRRAAKTGRAEEQAVRQAIEAAVEQREQQLKLQALSVAHEEDVSSWIAAIAQWIRQTHPLTQQLSLSDLQQGTQMPIIEIWIALLLGGYRLNAEGDFYSGSIWVELPVDAT